MPSHQMQFYFIFRFTNMVTTSKAIDRSFGDIFLGICGSFLYVNLDGIISTCIGNDGKYNNIKYSNDEKNVPVGVGMTYP